MKIQVFSVFDAKQGIYGQPNLLLNRATAERAFMQSVLDPQSNIAQHPEDFTVFHIGEYDDETAKFTNLPTPEPIGTALEFQARATEHVAKQKRLQQLRHEMESTKQ